MKRSRMGTTNAVRPARITFSALLAVLFIFTVTACDRPESDATATLRVQVPVGAINNAQRAALSIAGVPSSVTRVVINVAAGGNVVAGGDILAGSGELTLQVPAAKPLTVEGFAYGGDQLLFNGTSAVPPLRVGGSASIALVLNAVDGSLPPIVITARMQLDTNAQGQSANGDSGGVIFSADHRYALFRSSATDLVSGDGDDAEDLFQRDLFTNAIGVVTANRQGKTFGFTGAGVRPYGMSNDGRYVVFAQLGEVIDPQDTNFTVDLFVKDTRSYTITRLLEGPSADNMGNFPEAIATSGDAQRIAFETQSPPVTQSSSGVYVNDSATGALRFVDAGVRPSLSEDGKTLAYWKQDLQTLTYRLFIAEVDAILAGSGGVTAAPGAALPILASPPGAGVPAAADVSADGKRLTFVGRRFDDLNGLDRPMIYQVGTQTTQDLGTNAKAVQLQSGAADTNQTPALSLDDTYATFTFGASSTVYVKNTGDGQLAAVSNNAGFATISPDAAVVAFQSGGHLFVDNNPLLNPVAVSSAPEIKTVTLNNQVTLTWEPVFGATSYDVYAATDPSISASNYAQLGGVRFEDVSSPFTVSGAQLPSSGTYYFVVVPVNTAGTGPASNGASVELIGQPTNAPKSFDFYSVTAVSVPNRGLSALNPDTPAQPFTVEPAPTVLDSTTQSVQGATYTPSTTTFTNFYTHALIYARVDRKLYKVSALTSNGAPKPAQLSAEDGVCSSVAMEADYKNPDDSEYVYIAWGKDQTCATGDDEYRMVKLGMSATDIPLAAKPGYLNVIYDLSNGAIAGWLVNNDGNIQRCDANFANCGPTLASVNVTGTVVDSFGLNSVLLNIDSTLRVYNGDTNKLSSSVLPIPTGSFVSGSDWDGKTLYVGLQDSQGLTQIFAAPGDGSVTADLVAEFSQAYAYWWVAGNRIVYVGYLAGINTIDLATGKDSPLITVASGEYIATHFMRADRVYYVRYDDSNIPTAGSIKYDGTEKVEEFGSEWMGLSNVLAINVSAPIHSGDVFSVFYKTSGYSVNSGFANGTLTSVDAATGHDIAVLGTLPADIRSLSCYGVFGGGFSNGTLCEGMAANEATDMFFALPYTKGSLTRVTNTPSLDEHLY